MIELSPVSGRTLERIRGIPVNTRADTFSPQNTYRDGQILSSIPINQNTGDTLGDGQGISQPGDIQTKPEILAEDIRKMQELKAPQRRQSEYMAQIVLARLNETPNREE